MQTFEKECAEAEEAVDWEEEAVDWEAAAASQDWEVGCHNVRILNSCA